MGKVYVYTFNKLSFNLKIFCWTERIRPLSIKFYKISYFSTNIVKDMVPKKESTVSSDIFQESTA